MKIHWIRIIIVGFLLQLLTTVVVSTFQLLTIGFPYVILSVEFALVFLAGLCVAWKTESRFVLHGISVGILADVLYTLTVLPTILNGQMSFSWPLLFAYIVKIAGAGLGAYVAGNRRKKHQMV